MIHLRFAYPSCFRRVAVDASRARKLKQAVANGQMGLDAINITPVVEIDSSGVCCHYLQHESR